MSCSGKRCPMQIGFKVKDCELGRECKYYTDANDEIYHWALRGIVLAKSAGITLDQLKERLDIVRDILDPKSENGGNVGLYFKTFCEIKDGC